MTGYAGSWAHSLYSSVRCDNDRAFCLDDGECLCVPIGTACNKQGCSKIPEEGLWYWNDDDGKWDCYNKCYDGLNKGECSWNCACDNTKKPDDGNGWECLPDGTWYCTTNINWCADGPGFEKCMSYCPCDDAKKTDAGDAWTCDEMGWSGKSKKARLFPRTCFLVGRW